MLELRVILSLCTMVGEISVGYHFIVAVGAKIKFEYVEAAADPKLLV